MRVTFDQGTLRIEKSAEEPLPPFATRDERVRAWRCFAMHYADLKSFCGSNRLAFESDVGPFEELSAKQGAGRLELPAYQAEALAAWEAGKSRGVIVCPRGRGRFQMGAEAVRRVGRSALIVAPTLERLAQWFGALSARFSGEIGRLGGGEHEIRPVTVATYDSAYRWVDRYGSRFALAVFDEVRHLPAPSYSQIAQMLVAPFRLGLTAALERPDFRHVILREWIGPVVGRRSAPGSAGEREFPCRVEVKKLPLTRAEEEAFAAARGKYAAYLKRHDFRGRDPFSALAELAESDPAARDALRAFREARQIVLNAESKEEWVGRVLKKYRGRKILLFAEQSGAVYRLSRRYLLPAITDLTSPSERRWILEAFGKEKVRAIVTSKVLDGGTDVPEADVGVFLGGRAEHARRLGRLLRSVRGQEPVLLRGTTEAERALTSERRIRAGTRPIGPPAQPDLFADADV